MPIITIETKISAPIELCFDLSRDVELHCSTAAYTQERAVAGKTSGLLELGDQVTFEAVHFGIKQRLGSKIVEYDRPHKFTDEMISGAFKSLRHTHEFKSSGEETIMRDILKWESPLGILGVVADKLAVERHMRNFLLNRNRELKKVVEMRARSDNSSDLTPR